MAELCAHDASLLCLGHTDSVKLSCPLEMKETPFLTFYSKEDKDSTSLVLTQKQSILSRTFLKSKSGARKAMPENPSTLQFLHEFLVYHNGIVPSLPLKGKLTSQFLLEHNVSEWNVAFLEKVSKMDYELADLAIAAATYGIPSLFQLCSAQMASMIWKTAPTHWPDRLEKASHKD